MKNSQLVRIGVAGISILVITLLATRLGKSESPAAGCLATNTGYQFCVDLALLGQLTVEEMKESDGEFQKTVFDSGAISASTVYYTDLTAKQKHILMSVFLFPAAKFDAAANPNEPPMFGQEVIRKDESVFSVAGPQDSMFDPETKDGQNINTLYTAMYNPQSWVQK